LTGFEVNNQDIKNMISWELFYDDSIFGGPFQSCSLETSFAAFWSCNRKTTPKKYLCNEQEKEKKLEKLLMKQYILCSSYFILFITTHNYKLVKKRS
jgi:hypothetical protein